MDLKRILLSLVFIQNEFCECKVKEITTCRAKSKILAGKYTTSLILLNLNKTTRNVI